MDFTILKRHVAERIATLSKQHNVLFVADTDRDEIWSTYLNAFPEGTNPIYRKRTEHDCSCCRSFIRQIGNVVALVNNEYQTIWDINIAKEEPAYQAVADAMAKYVKSKAIANIFITNERTVGQNFNFEQLLPGATPVKHNHFYASIAAKFIQPKASLDTIRGKKRSAYDVTLRGLRELTLDSAETVLELITQNSLYRGADHKAAVQEFVKHKRAFDKLTPEQQSPFVWNLIGANHIGIRNTVIGTLLIDLSNGDDLDGAVRSFERKVAPENYQRPTALVTKRMIEEAKATMDSLGLTSAIHRRLATIADVSIVDLLHANRDVKSLVKHDDAFGALTAEAGGSYTAKQFSKLQTVSIEQFLTEYLPTASLVEVFVEAAHRPNFVSLIAPEDPTARQLFKWDNPYSWSYVGETADAIKERVKAAGGNVEGDVCIRLAWSNHDDLDLFVMEEPIRGERHRVYFANRYSPSPNGGQLDVDANAGGGHTRTPVENIVYPSASMMKPGVYKVSVNTYSKRESTNNGFTVDIALNCTGEKYSYEFATNKSSGDNTSIATISVDKDHNVKVEGNAQSSSIAFAPTAPHWGIPLNTFRKVSAVSLSPNFWGDNAVGNKHYFFFLEGCVNDDSARGFYNEFLRNDLTPHRKVLELVGARQQPTIVENQLSGVGFSVTVHRTVTMRVTGKTTRIINVAF